MSMCERVQQELATLVESQQPAELRSHLDLCDGCALALARACRTTESIASLGEGFVMPADLVQRTLRAISNQPTGPRWRRAWETLWGSVPGRLALLGGGLATAVVLVLSATPARLARRSPTPVWARVLGSAVVQQQAADGKWRRVADQRIDLRRAIRVGDARIRLVLEQQQVRLALARGSRLSAGEDSLHLTQGRLLAEVEPRRERPPLVIQVPTGMVEVLGTKLHLSADKDLALVDVIHGTVRVSSGKASALVTAGQEGALARRQAPSVSMAPDLGRTLSWTDQDDQEGPSADPLPAGLGTLTARRPGRTEKATRLRLQEHRVAVRVQGGLARTEITETFHNPTGNTLEGIYRFPLPSGARISRLALYVDGRLEEGTVVERERAAKIWRGVIRQATPTRLRKKHEEYVWVPGPWRDPALLQWREGNQFELRIFPIPPRGQRKVILAYTETLPRTARGRRYVYPLPRSSGDRAIRAGSFRFGLHLAGHDPAAPLHTVGYDLDARLDGDTHHLSYEAAPFEPAGDLVVDFATEAGRSPVVARTHLAPDDPIGYVQLSVKAQLPAYRTDRPRDLVLLVDRSQSTVGEAGRRSLMLVQALVAEMDRRDRVALLACDSDCRQLGGWATPSRAEARRLVAALGQVQPGGATDLGQAIVRAAALLAGRNARAAGGLPGSAGRARATHSARSPRVIYVGDGIPTVGELEPARLAAVVRRQLGPHRVRLTTLGVGTSTDATLLAAISRAGGGSHVAYGPGMTVRGQALQVLARQYGVTLEEVKVELPQGLSRVAPQHVPLLHQGEELVLVGRASGPVRGEVVLSGRVNGEPFRAAYPVKAAMKRREGNAFLPRLWAQLTVEDLLAEGGEQQRQAIVELSKRHYLLTRYTSLLVLESEAMRRAFGVAQGRRSEEWSGREAAAENEASGDGAIARGLGTLGKLATAEDDPLAGLDLDGNDAGDLHASPRSGSTGRGRGHGSGPPASERPGDHIPKVMPRRHSASVMGSLDRSIIQRVIRRDLAAIRQVYERQLKQNPNLSGRLAVSFTIGATGQVTQVSVSGSTLNDPQIERGVAQVVRRWRFPAPRGGGIVRVTYPFVFQHSGGSDGAPSPPSTPPPTGRRWVRMKRVYFQESQIRPMRAPGAHDLQLVARRRLELEQQPDSRDRHRSLFRALSRSGEAREALALLEAWLEHEPNSAEALSLMAETAGRLGQRERALRALGSLVELDPRDARLHTRLSALLDALGATRAACAHWISLAAVTPKDPEAARRASDCRDGFRPAITSPVPHGSVVLDGSWEGDEDIDLALVTRSGRRIAWLGGFRSPRFAHAASTERERLALRWLPAGRYRVEVSRAAATASPVRGNLVLRAPGLRQRLRFQLDPDTRRTYLAELTIHRRSRLEPAP